MAVDTSMAGRLRQSRIEAGYDSIREACAALGWKYPTYVSHENGQKGFVRRANIYASAYNVSVEWLLTGEPPAKLAGATVNDLFTLENYDAWPKELRAQFEEFIKLTNQSDPAVISMIMDVALMNYRFAVEQRSVLPTEQKQSG